MTSFIAEVNLEDIITWIKVRDLTETGIKRLKTKIQEKGYLERYPIAVTPLEDGKYKGLDGTHRYEAVKALNGEKILAQIFEGLTEEQEYRIAFESNEGLDTIIPQDWTDHAGFIWRLSASGKTQEQIAGIVKWGRGQVSNYQLLGKVCPEAWSVVVATTKASVVAKSDQDDVAEVATIVANPFSEGLLRSITSLTSAQQVELVKDLTKGKIDKGKFKAQAEKYRARNDLLAEAEKQFQGLSPDYLERAAAEINKGSYDKEWLVNKAPGDSFWKLIQLLKDEHAERQNYRLILGDMAVKGVDIPDESVDCIITDPPYVKDAIPLYEQLALLAARVLKPGGSLLVMTGQSYLPEILALMTPHIRYHWLVAYLTPGGQAVQLWKRNVNTFWKPVLWFVKGEYSDKWVGDVYANKGGDVAKSNVNDNDKRFHKWGQSESGMADLVERFTLKGEEILDPFMGAGTTGVVAVALGRKFIGIDDREENVKEAETRITESGKHA